MSECKRVLQVLGTTNLGGAESRIMDLYRHIDRDKLQFDFLIHTDTKGHFDDEIEALGGHIYRLPQFRLVNIFAYRQACRVFFQNHHDYVAIHGHMTSTASIYLPIARQFGVSLTIAHARSAGVDRGVKGILTKWLRRGLYKKADVLLSCSDLAAAAVFGEKRLKQGKVIIMPNAIDVHSFSFNQKMRENIRQQYALEDAYVIGHVGRFHYAKNHEYLIRIFEEIYKENSKARLLLIGDGPLCSDMKELCREKNLSDKVIFAGNQTPVNPYYQAMDLFVFPSRFEGMPGTVVEAQAAGLPCLISDSITREVKGTELVHFYSIEESPQNWAIKAAEYSTTARQDMPVDLIRNGYDVCEQVKRYEKFYLTGNTVFLKEGL